MTTSTVTEYELAPNVGCVMLHDMDTGKRLWASMYGGKFGRTRDEARAYVTDYAQRKGIVIVEEDAQTTTR